MFSLPLLKQFVHCFLNAMLVFKNKNTISCVIYSMCHTVFGSGPPVLNDVTLIVNRLEKGYLVVLATISRLILTHY